MVNDRVPCTIWDKIKVERKGDPGRSMKAHWNGNTATLVFNVCTTRR
jgi:hypothetical protein